MTLTPVDAFGFAAFAAAASWPNLANSVVFLGSGWIRIVSILLWGAYGWATFALTREQDVAPDVRSISTGCGSGATRGGRDG